MMVGVGTPTYLERDLWSLFFDQACLAIFQQYSGLLLRRIMVEKTSAFNRQRF
jgi:hypothetical protein